MMSFKLKDLDNTAQAFLASFLFTMQIGIFIGIGYIYFTTNLNPEGTIEHYNGSEIIENEIPEEYPKSLESMILNTHAHINSFAIISLLIGFIFYFNSIIGNKLKLLLLIEPFISITITFPSMWLMRYLNENFVFLVIISSFLMYVCWSIMVMVSFYELIKKNN